MTETQTGLVVNVDGLDVLVIKPTIEPIPTWKRIICGITEPCSSPKCHATSTNWVTDLSARRVPGRFCSICARRVFDRLARKYRKLTGDRSL